MKTANFTRGGDKGLSGLYGGKRLPKNDPVFEAVGTVDELNSAVGGVIAMLDQRSKIKDQKYKAKIKNFLTLVQNDLFAIQALLAGYDRNQESGIRNQELRVREMERLIEELDKDLPQLKNFILPGGSVLSAQFHVCRTVCRRAERRIVAYLDKKIKLENFPDVPIRYLNRFSSLFFVLARWANKIEGIEEVKWQKEVRVR